MLITNQLAYDTWVRCGSFPLAGKELGVTPGKVRLKVRQLLTEQGDSIEGLTERSQLAKINEYTLRNYTNLREMVKNDSYPNGVAVYHVKDKLIYSNPGNHSGHRLVGVYNRDSASDDVRDDLFWYIKNYMETNDAN
jgi:hypothetical protein